MAAITELQPPHAPSSVSGVDPSDFRRAIPLAFDHQFSAMSANIAGDEFDDMGHIGPIGPTTRNEPFAPGSLDEQAHISSSSGGEVARAHSPMQSPVQSPTSRSVSHPVFSPSQSEQITTVDGASLTHTSLTDPSLTPSAMDTQPSATDDLAQTNGLHGDHRHGGHLDGGHVGFSLGVASPTKAPTTSQSLSSFAAGDVSMSAAVGSAPGEGGGGEEEKTTPSSQTRGGAVSQAVKVVPATPTGLSDVDMSTTSLSFGDRPPPPPPVEVNHVSQRDPSSRGGHGGHGGLPNGRLGATTTRSLSSPRPFAVGATAPPTHSASVPSILQDIAGSSQDHLLGGPLSDEGLHNLIMAGAKGAGGTKARSLSVMTTSTVGTATATMVSPMSQVSSLAGAPTLTSVSPLTMDSLMQAQLAGQLTPAELNQWIALQQQQQMANGLATGVGVAGGGGGGGFSASSLAPTGNDMDFAGGYFASELTDPSLSGLLHGGQLPGAPLGGQLNGQLSGQLSGQLNGMEGVASVSPALSAELMASQLSGSMGGGLGGMAGVGGGGFLPGGQGWPAGGSGMAGGQMTTAAGGVPMTGIEPLMQQCDLGPPLIDDNSLDEIDNALHQWCENTLNSLENHLASFDLSFPNGGPPAPKKRRSKLSRESISILREWFVEHIKDPYPKDDTKVQLAKQAGLTVKQVNTWFTNTRKRVWQPYLANKKAQTDRKVAIKEFLDAHQSSKDLNKPELSPFINPTSSQASSTSASSKTPSSSSSS